MDQKKKNIHLIIDNNTYTPKLLRAALDIAVAAKHTDYANIRIIMPPALLYEISGFKACDAGQLLSQALRKDTGVRNLRALIEYGLQEQVLTIPNRSTAETEFFRRHGLLNGARHHTASLAGPASPKDFADYAIVDWLRNHQPDANTHFIISTQDSPLIADLMDAIPGNKEGRNHLNYFEQFDQKCTALWLEEESRQIQRFAIEHQPTIRPIAHNALVRLSDSVPPLADIKSSIPTLPDTWIRQ